MSMRDLLQELIMHFRKVFLWRYVYIEFGLIELWRTLKTPVLNYVVIIHVDEKVELRHL